MGYVKETSPATLYGGATVTWYWPGIQEGDKPIFDVRATLSLPPGTGVTIFWANQPMTITFHNVRSYSRAAFKYVLKGQFIVDI